MEIERKFLIDGFPQGLPLLEEAVVYQGYLCVDPVVRIRSKETAGKKTSYVLCFKGEGTLARQEIEMDLRCIGAPIFDFSKSVIGAVSICGPIYRMGDMRMKEIAPEIVRCSRLISYRMGYKEGIQ